MLKFLRNSANSWFIKILMILLALTFVLWGVGDTLRQSNKIVAFKVGDQEFTQLEWSQAYNQQVRLIEQQLNKRLEPEEAKAMGVNRIILNQLINRSLLSQEARDLGLLVSEDMVKYEISSMPLFIKEGRFDKEKFERVLRSSGMSEGQFVEMLKEDLASQSLAIIQGINKELPKSYVSKLTQAMGETRVLDLYKIDSSSIKVGVPSDDELRKTYAKHSQDFYENEKRDINYVKFDINSLKKEPVATDQEVREYYENNKMIYTFPASRKVNQMIFKDAEKAKEAEKALSSGKSFAEAAKDIFPGKTNFLLGDKITTSSFEPEITAPIFSTEVGSVSQPIKTPLGWHIFEVVSETKEIVKPLAEVKEQVAKQLKDEKRFEALSNLAQDIEGDVVLGISLSDLSEKYSLKIHSIRDWIPDENDKDVLLANKRFSTAAFSTELGTMSSVTPYDKNDKFFVLKVDSINPKRTKALDEVKADIVKIWIQEKRNDLKARKAKDVLAALKKAEDIKAVTAKYGISMPKSAVKLSKLDPQGSNITRALQDEIFKASKGEFTIPVQDSKGDFYFAKIVDFKPLDNQQLMEKSQMVGLGLYESIGEEMMSQYLSYLRSKYEIKVYDEVVNS